MRILDAISRRPNSLIWAGAILILTLVGAVDYVTPWKFSLFMFYAFAIFGVAWTLGLRAALGFSAACLVVSSLVNLGSYPVRGWHGYAWSIANRAVAFSFVAACGSAVRSYRDAALARIAAMEHTRLLEQQVVRTGESEQRRIGQDLHDGVCQTLSAISCATECLKRALEAKSDPQAANADQIQRMLSAAIVELRNLAHSMSPVHLTSDGLAAALEALVQTTNQLRQSGVESEVDREIKVSDPAVAMHLYRIAQEALSNAMKHAEATHVKLSLKRDETGIRLLIADDGRGLPEDAGERDGMGLHTMEYRANLIAAQLSVRRNAGGGAIVECLLPAASAVVEPVMGSESWPAVKAAAALGA